MRRLTLATQCVTPLQRWHSASRDGWGDTQSRKSWSWSTVANPPPLPPFGIASSVWTKLRVATKQRASRLFYHDGDDLLGGPHTVSSGGDRTGGALSRPLQGVFTACAIKKFTPIHVLPDPVAQAYWREERAAGGETAQDRAEEKSENQQRAGGVPYLVDRVREPRDTISLRRFLALRHCWQSGAYFHISTENGWYLLTPSWSVTSSRVLPPASATEAGGVCGDDDIAAWCHNLHPRYAHLVVPTQEGEKQEGGGGRDAASSGEDEEEWTNKVEMFRQQQSAALYAQSPAAEWENTSSRAVAPPHDGADHAGSKVEDEEGKALASAKGAAGGHLETLKTVAEKKKKRLAKKRRGADDTILCIPESHLFEINDGVQWPLPPLYDVATKQEVVSAAALCETLWARREPHTPLCTSSCASPQGEHDGCDGPSEKEGGDEERAALFLRFFRRHLARVKVYEENGGGWSLEEEEEFVSAAVEEWKQLHQPGAHAPSGIATTTTPPPTQREGVEEEGEGGMSMYCAALPTEVAVAAFSRRLFRVYTRKANVQLTVDEKTQRLTLVALRDLPAGTELQLHYGREWWTEHFLYPLLLLREAVRDGDHSTAWLTHAVQQVERLMCLPTDVFEPFPLLHARRRPSRRAKKAARGHGAECPTHRQLYNQATKSRASDPAVVAVAVQHSLLRPSWLRRLFGIGQHHATGDGRDEDGGRPDEESVFDILDMDKEIPISRLRRALLQELTLAQRRRRAGGGIGTEESAKDAAGDKRDEGIPGEDALNADVQSDTRGDANNSNKQEKAGDQLRWHSLCQRWFPSPSGRDDGTVLARVAVEPWESRTLSSLPGGSTLWSSSDLQILRARRAKREEDRLVRSPERGEEEEEWKDAVVLPSRLYVTEKADGQPSHAAGEDTNGNDDIYSV